MKTILKSFLLVAFGAFLFASCEKDEFSEKDAMVELRHIDVVLTVIDPSSSAVAVEGVVVKIVGDSTNSEKTTDASGSVVFEDMPIGGNLGVFVEKENYTKAFYLVDVETDSYGQSRFSETLPIYSLDGKNIATIEGQLTIETDLTNRSRETLPNQMVQVFNRGLGPHVESSFWGRTDENGFYSIKVPVNTNVNDYLFVTVPSVIDTMQTLAMEVEDGVFDVVSVPAKYYASSQGYGPSNIPSVSSAAAHVEAPGTVGSGFSLGVEVRETALSDYSNVEVVSGGSGYTDGVSNVPFSEDGNGNAATAVVSVSEGYVQSVTIGNDNGALYTSAPTLDLSSLGGSGADLDIQFECEYLVFIEDYGSDYRSIPNVSATYREYSANEIFKRADNNLNSGNDLGAININYYLTLHYGTILPNDNVVYDGDTLFVTTGFVDAPELEVESFEGRQAAVVLNVYNNGSLGYGGYTAGNGYDPANPPAVNVLGLAGYGSGAKVVVEVNSNGQVYNVEVLDPGKGYVANVNDYLDRDIAYNQSGETGSANSDGNKVLYSVAPGTSKNVNWYYGTGQRME